MSRKANGRRTPSRNTRTGSGRTVKSSSRESGSQSPPFPIEAGLFHGLFTSAHEGMFLAGSDGRILRANRAFYRLVGIRSSQREFLRNETFIAGNAVDTYTSGLRKLRRSHGPSPWFSVNRVDAKGRPLPCRERVTIVRDVKGKFLYSFHQIQETSDEMECQSLLKEQVQRAEILFESSPEPMWIIDAATKRFVAVNSAAIRTFGYSRKKFLTLRIRDLHPAEPQAGIEIPGNDSHVIIREYRTRQRKVIQAEVTTTPTKFEGKPAELTIARDVTSRLHAVQALQLGEMRFRAMIEKSSDVVAIIGVDGLITYASPVGERILGHPTESVIGTDPFALLHPEDIPKAKELLRNLLYGKKELMATRFRIRHLNGNWRWIEVDAANHVDNPAIKGIIINYKDVTERVALEDRLQLSDQILHKVGTLVLVADSTGNIVYASDSTEQILGYKPEEVLGKGWWQIRREQPGDASKEIARMSGVLKGSVPFTDSPYERLVYHKNGQARWISWQDSFGPEGLLIGVGQDITLRREAEEALRLSEERLKMVFENSEDMIFVQDLKGRYLYYNEKRQYGVKSDELLAKTPYELHEAETADAIMRRISEVARTGKSVLSETQMAWHGQQMWFSDCSYPIRDTNGKVVAVATISRDISNSRKAEKELHTLRKAVDSSREIIFLTDRHGVFTFVNPAFTETYGYTPEEVIGKVTPRILKSGKLAQETYDDFWHTILTKRTLTIEVINRTKDGQLCRMDASVSAVLDERKEITGFLAIQRNITEEHRIKEKIREQAALLDIAQDAIIVMDMQDKISYWNKGAERLFGWTEGETLGKAWNELVYRGSPTLRKLVESTVLIEGEWSGELPNAKKDGSDIVVESRWSLIRDGQGQPTSKLVVNTDITAKKRLERQFLRSQRMESVGTLAGGIAHDLNNVLAPLLMAVALLRKKLPGEPDQKLLDGLETTVKRGASLVKQVLSFSRGTELDRTILQVRHLIDEIKKFAIETFPANIEIQAVVPKDLWTITGDATQIHQIILNLCVNARDAMPVGGRLTIEAKNFYADENFAKVNVDAKQGHYVLISVTDTGIGIPPEIRDKIFEPFFTTKEVGKGTGLGLSTVYGIIRSHKGLVHVYSEPGNGTRFNVYLPATDQEVQSDIARPAAMQVHGANQLIMVVDDEPAVCEVARLTLEGHGYRVITATDGAEALSVYIPHQHELRLVITDVNMPLMDGSALIRAIRRFDPGMRFIVSTGLSDSVKMGEIPRSEVQGILNKPFTADGLLSLVNEALLSAKPTG